MRLAIFIIVTAIDFQSCQLKTEITILTLEALLIKWLLINHNIWELSYLQWLFHLDFLNLGQSGWSTEYRIKVKSTVFPFTKAVNIGKARADIQRSG